MTFANFQLSVFNFQTKFRYNQNIKTPRESGAVV